MNIGKMRQQIVITPTIIVVDDYGQGIVTAGTTQSVWAEVTEIAQPEEQVDGGTANKRRIKCQLRWYNGLTVMDTLIHRGLTYNITDIIDPFGTKAMMILTAESQQ